METRVLQIVVFLGALVPIYGGGVGVLRGASAFGAWPGAAADSQVRYLSGLLLAIGLAYWACAPTIARRGAEIRLLTVIVLAGGLSRLAGVFLAGDPGRMCSISQRLGALTFVNETGTTAAGNFTGPSHLIANWQGTPIGGTISPDGSRISWDNGTFWSR